MTITTFYRPFEKLEGTDIEIYETIRLKAEDITEEFDVSEVVLAARGFIENLDRYISKNVVYMTENELKDYLPLSADKLPEFFVDLIRKYGGLTYEFSDDKLREFLEERNSNLEELSEILSDIRENSEKYAQDIESLSVETATYVWNESSHLRVVLNESEKSNWIEDKDGKYDIDSYRLVDDSMENGSVYAIYRNESGTYLIETPLGENDYTDIWVEIPSDIDNICAALDYLQSSDNSDNSIEKVIRSVH